MLRGKFAKERIPTLNRDFDMWRSFFFAVGIILLLIGLQCLMVENFRVDKNSRIFAVAAKANRALDSSPQQNYFRPQNELGTLGNQAGNFANRQRFSLPSAESYYGGPSRFHNPNYPTQPGYGGRTQFGQQSLLPVNQVSNPLQVGIGNGSGNLLGGPRVKALRSYPVKDWMPWGFLAAGTIISLYTNSTRHSRYSDD